METKRREQIERNKIDRKHKTAVTYFPRDHVKLVKQEHGDVPVTVDAYLMKPSAFAEKYNMPFPTPAEVLTLDDEDEV